MNVRKKTIGLILPTIVTTLLTACNDSNLDKRISLSFKYMLIAEQSYETNFSFQEDPDYPNIIATYIVEQNHVITAEDMISIDSLTSFIPHNQGGYYVRTAYFSNYHNPFSGIQLAVGYECILDTTFYYSFTGGPAQSPDEVNCHG